jgi:hypothetical protein
LDFHKCTNSNKKHVMHTQSWLKLATPISSIWPVVSSAADG